MAPSGRTRKVGLRRMDAAIDAMKPLGFPREVVRKTINRLLKVYGGDEGWVFIEEASYKLLIEAILEALEKSEQEKGSNKDESLQEKVTDEDNVQLSLAGPPNEVSNNAEPSVARLISRVQDVAVSSAAGPASGVILSVEEGREGRGWRDIVLEDSCPNKTYNGNGNDAENSAIPNVLYNCPAQSTTSSHPVDGLPKQRRKPCYGWIGDDEINLLNLKPTLTVRQFEDLLGGAERRRKRKSRWDVGPDDL